jgi:parvulin-like peptidyl-prolyl isomerase
MTRRSVAAFRTTVVAAVLAFQLLSCTKEPQPRADGDVPVALVDGDRISLKDLKNEIAARRGFAPSVAARSAGRGEVTEALRLLIERAVVLAEGKRRGILVTDSEVEREIARFREDFPPGGLEKAIVQAGSDMETWREGMARSLLFRKTAGAIVEGKASVSDAEVEAAFRKRGRTPSQPERLRVRQYLFDSVETARSARAAVAGGEKPEDVVRIYSRGDSRPATVDLGYVAKEDLPQEIASELFVLKEGEVSAVVSREETHSLFQVVRKEPARPSSQAAAAPEIREELSSARREEAFRSWISERMRKADVRVQEALLSAVAEGKK